MNEITLERFKAVAVSFLDSEYVEKIAACVKLSVMQDFDNDDLVLLRFTIEAAGEWLRGWNYEHPTNWWQAAKERFAPQWFKRRWPVEYTKVTARAVYPFLSLPDEPHHVHFAEKAKAFECDG